MKLEPLTFRRRRAIPSFHMNFHRAFTTQDRKTRPGDIPTSSYAVVLGPWGGRHTEHKEQRRKSQRVHEDTKVTISYLRK